MTQKRTGDAHMVEVELPATDGTIMRADVSTPSEPAGTVIFAHGSGSSRKSPRNRQVAAALQRVGFRTVLVDLLTEREERRDRVTGALRFDIPMLAERVVHAVDWSEEQSLGPIGLFGASTGAAAALIAAGARPGSCRSVVSRGGRPDLAGEALGSVRSPTLLIVGGEDREVIRVNERAMAQMCCEVALEIVPGATHLFEEPGALETVARLAGRWFGMFLGTGPAEPRSSPSK